MSSPAPNLLAGALASLRTGTGAAAPTFAAAERDSARLRMRRKRAEGAEIFIPAPADPARRAAALEDPLVFLPLYLPTLFYRPFTPDQRAVVHDFLDILQGRGDKQAIAAPRGIGKTSICLGMIIYALCRSLRRFIVLFEGSGDLALRSLANIKRRLERSTLLAQDFPEICLPVRALEGAPQRAQSQIYRLEDGTTGRTYMEWKTNRVRLPEIPGSPASGATIVASGLDGSFLGFLEDGERPDAVVLNDPQTRESAHSLVQTHMRRLVIEEDIAFLAGPERPLAMFYLGTIKRPHDLTDEYTDPSQRPAWNGRRIKFLQRPPNEPELWEKYIELRRLAKFKGDPYARESFAFYWSNRRAMNAGAVVTDPRRYNHGHLPDGRRIQVSALQYFYDAVADSSWEHVRSELQNEPDEAGGPETLQLEHGRIQSQLSHTPRGTVPEGTTQLVRFIDLGGRMLHHETLAYTVLPVPRVVCVDYGVQPVLSPSSGPMTSDANLPHLHAALLVALTELWDDLAATPFRTITGEPRLPDATLIDAGWQRDPVFQFAAEHPRLVRPTIGQGVKRGQERYRAPKRKGKDRRPGFHAYQLRLYEQPIRWLWCLDADFWKRLAHERLAISTEQPGHVALYGEDATVHRAKAEQILAERWISEFIPGRGVNEYWDVTSRHNHWLDTLAGALAGLTMLGAPLVPEAELAGGTATRVKLSEKQRGKS